MDSLLKFGDKEGRDLNETDIYYWIAILIVSCSAANETASYRIK
jgi:hypothetical protein